MKDLHEIPKDSNIPKAEVGGKLWPVLAHWNPNVPQTVSQFCLPHVAKKYLIPNHEQQHQMAKQQVVRLSKINKRLVIKG